MKRIYLLLIFVHLIILQAIAQDVVLTGKVISADGDPISSVSISAQPGNKVVGSTNGSGAFSVKVSSSAKSLVFRGLGYKTQTVSIGSSRIYNVTLSSNTEDIETVEIAYTARKKETLTGSAVVIDAKALKDAPAANFTDLLQGRVAGLNTQLNNGTPGMRGSMSLRGLNSSNVSMSGSGAFLTQTSPLFVIDGVPIDEGSNYEYGFQTQGPGISPLSMIPVEDLESIVVLKDAQATALYGSRGAYGVILVTTKRGNSSIPIVSYQSKYFMGSVPTLRPIIGGKEENRLRVRQILSNDTSYREALMLINDTEMLADSLNPYYNNSTNWQGFFYGNTFNTQQSLNFSGGNQQFNYKVAPGYYKEAGIVRNTGFTRYSMNTNMQYRPVDAFVLSGYINANMARNSTGSGNAFEQRGVANSINTSSLMPSPSIFSGSYEAMAASSVINDNKTGYLNSQVEMEYEIFKGLRLKSNVNYQYTLGTQDRFSPEILNSGESSIYGYNSKNTALNNRNMIQFNGTLFGDERHVMTAVVFNEVTFRDFRAEAFQMYGTGSDQIHSGLSYNSRRSDGGYLNNLSNRRELGYVGNVSYQYDGKYIFELGYRLDGTSTSGAANPWSHSPTLGLRYNFYKEAFFSKLDWLSEASARLSWGRNIFPTGSIYDVYGKYIMQSQTYNNQPTVSIDLNKIPNINLVPITTTQLNLAVELGFFKNMFRVVYENYYKENTNELAEKKISSINGFGSVTTNEKAIVNKGHEASIFYTPRFENTDWKTTINANFAYNKDTQSQLPDNVRQLLQTHSSFDYINILQRLGRNTFSNVLYHYRGVYQSDADVPVNPATGLRYRASNLIDEDYFFQAGDPIFTDLNGDYVLDKEDLVVAGNSRPLMTGGFGATIQYKNWTLQPNFIFTLKRDIINRAAADKFRNYYYPQNSNALVPIDEYDAWSLSNLDAKYPNPFDFRRSNIVNGYRYNSTLFQEDGSYLKLGSTTISYNVNREYTQKRLGIYSLRFYLNGNNLYTWSKYSGPDPELVTDLGYDESGGYPRARTYTFGLDIQF